MNTCFDKKANFDSNKRIIEAYFGEDAVCESPLKKYIDQFLFLLAAVLRTLTCTKARRICKALSLAVCLVGFVGIIGAMERGVIGLGLGFLIGLAMIGIEVLCLRPQRS